MRRSLGIAVAFAGILAGYVFVRALAETWSTSMASGPGQTMPVVEWVVPIVGIVISGLLASAGVSVARYAPTMKDEAPGRGTGRRHDGWRRG